MSSSIRTTPARRTIQYLLRRKKYGRERITNGTATSQYHSSRFITSHHGFYFSSTTNGTYNKISTTTKRQAKSFSSNAAAVVLADQTEEEDEDDEDYSTTTASTSKQQYRPRLKSLRETLRKEEEEIEGIQSFANKNNTKNSQQIHVSKTSSLSRSSTKKTTSSSSSSSNLLQLDDDKNNTNIYDLIEQLDALPMPKTTSSDNEELLLQDKFGRQHSYLRISLSEKCNLRCLYCMPLEGIPLQPQSDLLSNDEIIQLATWFTKHGVDKIRLTGGEPLLRKDLTQLISNLNELGLKQIGMTTNGVTLSKQLPELVDAGLSHVNISLDSLDSAKFAKLTRRPASYYDRVMKSIEDSAKLLPYKTKINCVVMPDNLDEIQQFCNMTRDMPVDVRFIEYMPFNDNLWNTKGFVSYEDMQNQISGLTRLDDGPNDTTKWWTLATSQEETNKFGRIGFITSMSQHFCGTCNRLRITADGKLKVCLFGTTEISLRDLLRHDDFDDQEGRKQELLSKLIHYSVQKKHFKLGGHKDMEDLQQHSTENRPMTLIGG